MRLVYSFNIDKDDRLLGLCKVSKNLYNQALYIVKQELKTNNKWLGYYDLDKIMKITPNLEGDINYRLLKSHTSQQCLKILCNNITSYVKNIKEWSKNKSKFSGKPNFPKYKKEANILIYTNQTCQIKGDYLVLSKDIKIHIPQYDKYADKLSNFQQVRVIPKSDGKFKVEIVYVDNTIYNYDLDSSLYSSIDLGVDNLATMVLPNQNPILFNGRPLKATNQYFNKTISNLKSKLFDKQYSSKRIRGLYEKRNNVIKDYFHKVSRSIVNLLIENKVGNIVVGYNKGWKESINIGKRNNQTFVSIPYLKLIDYLRYKCEMVGIKIIVSEEGYTSKCDALACEPICKHESYLGKRVKRGLFQSSVGKLINADVNGALNILRKVISDSEYELYIRIVNSGWLFQPVRVNVYKSMFKLTNRFYIL